MRYAGQAAVICLLLLTVLAGYGLWLRVAPYGLTPDRIIAGACLIVSAAYALGYAYAFRAPKSWLASLPKTNLWVSYLILALLLALFTPLADPARLSVVDQIARLKAGKIAPEKFDYDFLHFKSARYGREALNKLAALKDAPHAKIAELATASLKRSYAGQSLEPQGPAELTAQISVYPTGTKLPDSFFNQDWRDTSKGWFAPACFTNKELHCEAFLLDVDGDGAKEVIVREVGTAYAAVLKEGSDKHWTSIGSLELPNTGCQSVDNALRAGEAKAVPSTLRDVEIGGGRYNIEAPPRPCPEKG